MSEPVFIGLGSNLGNRSGYLKRARERLRDGCLHIQPSSVRETTPQGVDTDRSFLNQVVRLTKPDRDRPEDVLEWLLSLERRLGRDRARAGPDRVIDLDLLYWGQRVREEDPVLPHPRLHLRGFVLRPMVELAPDFHHPVRGRSQRQLLHELESTAPSR